MRLALGCDHRGFEALASLKPWLENKGHTVTLLGECTTSSCDYPDSAFLVGSAVAQGEVDRGILICGSGIGMCMAANKVKGIRAALVSDAFYARRSREHNDANVLCLAGDMLGPESMENIIETWLDADFEGGRHARRVNKIMAIEQGIDPREVAAPAASADA